MNIEDLENLRREAYVKAVIRKSETDDVVGYIGLNVPVEIFYERGLMAVPVYGIDKEILKFSEEKNLCPLIDATVTYAKTDKCPLIHSSKLIIVEDFCPVFTRELSKLKDKEIYIYNGNNDELNKKLDEVYGILTLSRPFRLFKPPSLKRDGLSPFQIFTIEYFINFLDLSERINFLNQSSDVYLSQENRPEGMDYFNLVVAEIHGLRPAELVEHKKKGGKVVGTFCIHVPDEIPISAGAIATGLCSGSQF